MEMVVVYSNINIYLQGGYWQSSGLYLESTRVLYGDTEWLWHWRSAGDGSSACGRSPDLDHLHEEQIW